MVEVSSLSQVNQPGTYYINYDVGNIYWYQATGTTTFTATYKQLNFIGGSVQSTANTPYNEALYSITPTLLIWVVQQLPQIGC